METQTETETAENGLLFTLYLQEDDNFMLDKQKQIIVEGEAVENSEEVLQIIKVEDENNTVQIEDVGSEDEGVHLYICSQCGQGGFESIDAVRNHMIEVIIRVAKDYSRFNRFSRNRFTSCSLWTRRKK